MILVGLVLAGLAAALHVYIFVLESLIWTGPRARRTFGLDARTAEITKPLAFNQGFYNLFLAIAIFIGIVAMAADAATVGATLVFVGTGSMVAAALVLVLSDGTKARAAAVQGVLPLLATVALAIGLAA
ncbi:DUF1304 domain-containing protein [Microbacterium dauci]|uniref:DUF1304 domain-containing protein n=1 Tax=Microbacterium dauci TaxID=3048008 RepID=A0ABT6ZEH1_9MICO|nr:DUF1304 domain-containing protein [Microbacterium sp. LX3-4]MDJ1114562.1 DUF1304 domain-containing protein [Microbacterium sp. LX3-4]